MSDEIIEEKMPCGHAPTELIGYCERCCVMGGLHAKLPIVLSDEEAAELYRFTRYSYINLTTYPNLMRLLDRVSQQHAEQLTKG